MQLITTDNKDFTGMHIKTFMYNYVDSRLPYALDKQCKYSVKYVSIVIAAS